MKYIGCRWLRPNLMSSRNILNFTSTYFGQRSNTLLIVSVLRDVMSMCVQFVLMKTNATAIAVAIAVYRSHPFHIRFVLLLFLYCLLVACGDVRLMLLIQMLKCSFHIIYFLLFTPIRQKKMRFFFGLFTCLA